MANPEVGYYSFISRIFKECHGVGKFSSCIIRVKKKKKPKQNRLISSMYSMIPFCEKENRTKGCGACWRFQFSLAGGLGVVDLRLPAAVGCAVLLVNH